MFAIIIDKLELVVSSFAIVYDIDCQVSMDDTNFVKFSKEDLCLLIYVIDFSHILRILKISESLW